MLTCIGQSVSFSGKRGGLLGLFGTRLELGISQAKVRIDLFASEENAQCPLSYSLTNQNAPMGLNAFAYEGPCLLLYTFPLLELVTATLARVQETSDSNFDSPPAGNIG